MAYTNNVPQGNQTISSTQPLIQANFAFLDTGLSQEHNFIDAGSGSDMYHLQASMPNKALSPALPAGTNGQYFVSSASPYFYDGTNNWLLNPFQNVITGSFATNSSSTFVTIATIPANTMGIILLYNVNLGVQTGQYVSNGTQCFGYSNRIKINGLSDDYPVELKNDNTLSLDLQGRAFSSDFFGTYNYKIFYRPT